MRADLREVSEPRSVPQGRKLWLGPTAQSVALLLAAVVITYGASVTFQLLDWDDRQHLLDNPSVFPPSWSGFKQLWAQPYDHLYIPLSYTLFALEAWLSQLVAGYGRLSPVVFHATSLLLHGACTLAAWSLLRRLVSDEVAVLFGALLFALHPLQVESIAWVSEQRGLLSTLLALGAMNLYLSLSTESSARKVETTIEPASLPVLQQSTSACGQWCWGAYITASLLFAASLLAKPSAAVAPALVLLLVVGWQRQPWRRTLAAMAPWFAMAMAILLVTKSLQAGEVRYEVPGLGARLLIAGDALAFYLSKLVWPIDLGFDYGRRPSVVLAGNLSLAAWLLPVLVTMVAALRKTRRTWLVCWGFVVVGLSPVLGLVPFVYQDVSTTADRYMYLPMLGVGLALASLLNKYQGAVAMAAVGVCMGVSALLSFEQTFTWSENEALFTHGLEVNPHSFTAHYNLGARYLARQQFSQADEHLRTCLEISPHYAAAHNSLGVALASQGKLAQAMNEYRQAMADNPRLATAHGNLANALWKTGERGAAIAEYRQAVQLDPSDVQVRVNLASLLIAMGRVAEAVDELQQVTARRPAEPAPHQALAIIYQGQNRWPEAEAEWRAVLRSTPLNVDALCNLGLSLAKQTRLDEARDIWRKALAAVPPDSEQAATIQEYLAQWGVP